MRSFLDNDLYKFTMQQAVLALFPDAYAKYSFLNRGKHRFTEEFVGKLKCEISKLSNLKLESCEREWLKKTCDYFKYDYFEYLQNYRFDPSEVTIKLDNGDLNLSIEGLWHRTILWEVPLLSLISEVYFKTIDKDWDNNYYTFKDNLLSKFNKLNTAGCPVADFGTRRRRNYETQNSAVRIGSSFPNFLGTSNIHFARIHRTRAIGTMAHEWIMANSVLEGLRNANYYALYNWIRVYNADLGVALADTYGMDAFLRNFNLRMAKLYDGVRQDSGNPFTFVDRIVKHYRSLNIDPMSKFVVFSDNLNPDIAIEISGYCKGKIKSSFGIGTNLTNDFSYCNSPALNMVIKMCELNGTPVTKLSDEYGKECGDRDAIRVAKWTFYNESLDGE